MFPPRASSAPGAASGPAAPPSLTALNLRRLLLLRAVAIAGWMIALGVAVSELGLGLPFLALAVALGLWIGAGVWSWVRLRARDDIPDRLFFVQLLVDTAVLTMLLYITGGASNPLTLMLLLPLTVSAALLPGRYSWAVALITAVCYTALLFVYRPLPLPEHVEHAEFGIHLIGMWLGFVLSAALIAGFVARMGSTLRERDRLLAESRERALRDERIIALGALAAGAAHELGTPLNTIALLSEDIDQEYGAGDEALARRLRILREQVGRCKETLSMLSLSAGQSQAAAGRRLPIDRYLAETVEHWRSLRPGVRVTCDLDGMLPAPLVVAEQTLAQAMISLFNNAADAAAGEGVEIVARWDLDRLVLEVADHGAGVPPAALSAAGKAVFSTKGPGEGLGLGLYLAYSVIHRLQGEIELFNRESGGACTRVTLPLAPLRVPQRQPEPDPVPTGEEAAGTGVDRDRVRR